MKSPVRVIRDPIHGNIRIYNTEEPVLNSREFQRLRYISQLSFCSLVYPGAVHNRFTHSLGTMHLAGEMYRSLTLNSRLDFDPEVFLAVRLAAMLHDVGHGPFSHIFERAVAFFNSKESNPVTWSFQHSVMGLRIIKELLHSKIDGNIRNLVIKLLEGKGLPDDQWWLSQIISSEIDADRSDFLMRDSYYAGVTYGNYELNRLLETMTLAEQPPDNKTVLVFKKKGLMALESFMFARYNMYRGVYFHHTNLIGDAMVSRAIYELIKQELYPRPGITDPKEFVKWNDTRIIGLFYDMAFSHDVNVAVDPVHTTITGIISRRLWKRLKIAENLSNDQLKPLITSFADQQGIDADLFSEIITVKKIPYSCIPIHFEREKPARIYILDPNNRLQDLADVIQIQVPADFMVKRHILVHPDFIKPLTTFMKSSF
ncbi:MAG: HD domain-containing protein [Candidatus Hodarchaeota archaeon]